MNPPVKLKKKLARFKGLGDAHSLPERAAKSGITAVEGEGDSSLDRFNVSADFMDDRQQPEDQQRQAL